MHRQQRPAFRPLASEKTGGLMKMARSRSYFHHGGFRELSLDDSLEDLNAPTLRVPT